MTLNQVKLTCASLFIIIVMIVIVPILTAVTTPSMGIGISMCIYWFALCLPLSLYFLGWRGIVSALSLKTQGHTWVPFVCLALPVVMFAYLLWDIGPVFNIALALMVLPAALVNGTLEEVFWRGAFQKHADGNRLFWAIGLILFTAWHISLLLAVGITHHGGAVTLLGGAFALGLVWTMVTYVTGKIGWGVISHILINVIAFSMSVAQNA